MARRQGPEPKISRGVSLQRDLYARIMADANRLDISFNAAVEGALRRSFPIDANMHKTNESVQHDHGKEEIVSLP